jgi:hypothetical protein
MQRNGTNCRRIARNFGSSGSRQSRSISFECGQNVGKHSYQRIGLRLLGSPAKKQLARCLRAVAGFAIVASALYWAGRHATARVWRAVIPWVLTPDASEALRRATVIPSRACAFLAVQLIGIRRCEGYPILGVTCLVSSLTLG